MFTVEDLVEQTARYANDQISRDEFEDWFRTRSRGMYSGQSPTSDLIAAVEAALSEYHFETTNEALLKEEILRL